MTEAGAGLQALDETDVLLLKAIAGVGTVAGAATALGITTSAAVRRLGRLERRIDTQLVRGDSGRVWLTAAGRALLAAGLEFLDAVEAGARRMSDAAAARPPDPPWLRIAGFGTNWAGFVDDLAARLPGLLVDVHVAEPGAAAELFDRGRVDAMYAWHAPGGPLTSVRPAEPYPVLDEPLWVALPADHPAAGSDRVELAGLTTATWVSGPTVLGEQLIRITGRAAGFEPRIGPVVDTAPAARSLIAHGLGVALISPLTPLPAAHTRIVFRPLAGAPHRRLVLAVDGGVVSERLGAFLVRRLRSGYAATAQRRNPDYRRSADFPVTDAEPAESGTESGLLTGLRQPTEQQAASPRAGAIGLDDLHVLRVVADAGSVNRAARTLLISQPALSRRISRLERDLGAKLFVRSHRGSSLAPGAHVLLDEIDSAEANLRATLRSIVDKRVNGTPA